MYSSNPGLREIILTYPEGVESFDRRNPFYEERRSVNRGHRFFLDIVLSFLRTERG